MFLTSEVRLQSGTIKICPGREIKWDDLREKLRYLEQDVLVRFDLEIRQRYPPLSGYSIARGLVSCKHIDRKVHAPMRYTSEPAPPLAS